jgi:cobalamin biosynthesis protein CobW
MVVQGVRTRVSINQSNDAQPKSKSELVFIGYHLNRNHIAKLLADMTNSVWR